MKKQIVLAVAMLLTLAAIEAPAANVVQPPGAGKTMNVQVKMGQKPMTLEVQLDRLDKKRTVVFLEDMTGKVWLSEAIWRKESCGKLLNLSGMPQGDYILRVVGAAGEHLQMLALHEKSVSLFEPARPKTVETGMVILTGSRQAARTIVRITREDQQSVGVQMANLKQMPSSVTLYSVGAGPVLVQNIKNKQAYARKFDMKGMAAGSYLLSVKTEDATISQFFVLSNDGTLALGPLQQSAAKTKDPVN
jgi:hypothetical protein